MLSAGCHVGDHQLIKAGPKSRSDIPVHRFRQHLGRCHCCLTIATSRKGPSLATGAPPGGSPGVPHHLRTPAATADAWKWSCGDAALDTPLRTLHLTSDIASNATKLGISLCSAIRRMGLGRCAPDLDELVDEAKAARANEGPRHDVPRDHRLAQHSKQDPPNGSRHNDKHQVGYKPAQRQVTRFLSVCRGCRARG
jgi:hypothetical protein